MKHILVILIMVSVTQLSLAQQSLCGNAVGFTYNQDTIGRGYELSGFWVKQNTMDIRITYGNSPQLIEAVEKLKGFVFVCLDNYELKTKQYSEKPRVYGIVSQFRIWLNGKQVY